MNGINVPQHRQPRLLRQLVTPHLPSRLRPSNLPPPHLQALEASLAVFMAGKMAGPALMTQRFFRGIILIVQSCVKSTALSRKSDYKEWSI